MPRKLDVTRCEANMIPSWNEICFSFLFNIVSIVAQDIFVDFDIRKLENLNSTTSLTVKTRCSLLMTTVHHDT